MFCLLCHEKISRLRAWRTKSEFCSDEHAEIYKRQTLERLLTDHEHGGPGEAPPLPVENAAARPAKAPQESAAASETLARFEELDRQKAAKPSGLPSAERGERDEGLQELWRLSEETGSDAAESDEEWNAKTAGDSAGIGPGAFSLGSGLGGSLGSLGKGLGGGLGEVREQTPEEALAALRQLSDGPRRTAVTTDEPSDELRSLLHARGLDTAAEAQEDLDLNSISDLPGSFGDALSGEETLQPLDAASLQPLSDDELPSIFDRLTGHAGGELDLDDLPEVDAFANELQSGAFGAEGPQADQEPQQPLETQEAAAIEQARPEAANQETAAQETSDHEILAADVEEDLAANLDAEPDSGLDSEDTATFDLLEAAVDSHLDEAEPETAREQEERPEPEPPSRRGFSPKVVAFPLLRSKRNAPEPEEPAAPAGSPPAAAASNAERAAAKPAKGPKSGKGAKGDLSRLQLKPVAVMFGLEPSLLELSAAAAVWPSQDWTATQGADQLTELPICYPDAGGGRPSRAQLPVHARLVPLLPATPEAPPWEGYNGHGHEPDYSLPLETPLPLALGPNAAAGKPSVGSERAWMFQIEPALAEGPELALQLPNGNDDALWQAPRLPAGLASGVAFANGSGKLDLSGAAGRFEPPVDRLCLVFPQLGELGAGVSRPSSSKTPGEDPARWAPPTVLDPRFDIERPAGRDLSDFG